MFAVNFYTSCFVSTGNSVGKKPIRLYWEKVVCQLLFTLANTLLMLKEVKYFKEITDFKSIIM